MINDGFLLFHNLGKRSLFEDLGQRSGILAGTRQMTGWSLGMFDFDNDGWTDLFSRFRTFPRWTAIWAGPRRSPTKSSAIREGGDSRTSPPTPVPIFKKKPCTTAQPSPISMETAASISPSPRWTAPSSCSATRHPPRATGLP